MYVSVCTKTFLYFIIECIILVESTYWKEGTDCQVLVTSVRRPSSEKAGREFAEALVLSLLAARAHADPVYVSLKPARENV